MRTKLFLILPVLLIVGCNSQQTAQKAQQVIAAVLQVAQAEAPAIPLADQPAYNRWVALGVTLNGQLGTCNANASGLMGTSAKLKACFNTFATGFTSPAELAQLRIMSGAAQSKAQLILTGVIAGVNIAFAFTSPTISTPPTAAEVQGLAIEAGLDKTVRCEGNEDGNLVCTARDWQDRVLIIGGAPAVNYTPCIQNGFNACVSTAVPAPYYIEAR